MYKRSRYDSHAMPSSQSVDTPRHKRGRDPDEISLEESRYLQAQRQRQTSPRGDVRGMKRGLGEVHVPSENIRSWKRRPFVFTESTEDVDDFNDSSNSSPGVAPWEPGFINVHQPTPEAALSDRRMQMRRRMLNEYYELKNCNNQFDPIYPNQSLDDRQVINLISTNGLSMCFDVVTLKDHLDSLPSDVPFVIGPQIEFIVSDTERNRIDELFKQHTMQILDLMGTNQETKMDRILLSTGSLPVDPLNGGMRLDHRYVYFLESQPEKIPFKKVLPFDLVTLHRKVLVLQDSLESLEDIYGTEIPLRVGDYLFVIDQPTLDDIKSQYYNYRQILS